MDNAFASDRESPPAGQWEKGQLAKAPETLGAVGAVGPRDVAALPADYRDHLVRLLALMAYAENVGGEGLALLFNVVPDAPRKRVVSQIAFEEMVHADMVFDLLAELGIDEATAVQIAEGRTGGFAPIHNSLKSAEETYGDAENQWEDVILNHLLMDGAGIFVIENYAASSYAPLSEACRNRIRKDERMHQGFGRREFKEYLAQSPDASRLLERFSHWYAKALNFFGPPAGKTALRLKDLGLKRKDNDELRAEYQNEIRAYFGDFGDTGAIRQIFAMMDAVDAKAYPFTA
jgi:1,2-phenylacetyl-CoA epoxidase catalytic subunit